MNLKLIIVVALSVFSQLAFGVNLVSDETIKKQKELTKTVKLKNGIPVVIRSVPGSDIVELDVSWHYGLKNLPHGKKSLNQWLWSALPMAGKSHPKTVVNETIEKFGLEIDCNGGIELSNCSLSTLNDQWQQSLLMFADLINNPALTAEDVNLTKDRLIAVYKNTESDPNVFVNEIVNSVYYPKDHPYRLSNHDAIIELQKYNKTDLNALHQQVLNAALMSIAVVSSIPTTELIADLEKAFGSIQRSEVNLIAVPDPLFVEAEAYSVHDRELPTAYLRIKFPVPAMTHKDGVGTRFLFEILSEELGEEIRTKRSLSYAVHAFPIQYSRGIGVISVSTAKLKETLEALQTVINQVKNKTYSREELDEYRNIFATNYYLTQETHHSLADALAVFQQYFGDASQLYDLPRELDRVSPEDIRRLANEYLGNFRIGVIYGKKQFENQWLKDFIDKNRLAQSQKIH